MKRSIFVVAISEKKSMNNQNEINASNGVSVVHVWAWIEFSVRRYTLTHTE